MLIVVQTISRKCVYRLQWAGQAVHGCHLQCKEKCHTPHTGFPHPRGSKRACGVEPTTCPHSILSTSSCCCESRPSTFSTSAFDRSSFPEAVEWPILALLKCLLAGEKRNVARRRFAEEQRPKPEVVHPVQQPTALSRRRLRPAEAIQTRIFMFAVGLSHQEPCLCSLAGRTDLRSEEGYYKGGEQGYSVFAVRTASGDRRKC